MGTSSSASQQLHLETGSTPAFTNLDKNHLKKIKRVPAAPHLHFGPGGVPLSTRLIKAPDGEKYDLRKSALIRLDEMGLDLMEIEFVYGINISEKSARSLGQLAKEKNITLTVHGPYYINLASKEHPKYHASISRVQKTILAAQWLQAPTLTFHAGFYQGRSDEETTAIIEKALLECVTDENFLKKSQEDTNGSAIPLISLETTGKPTQWGSLEEIVSTSARLNEKLGREQFSVCVDFAHIYARSNGSWNSYDEFMQILEKIEAGLGKEALTHLHMHVSGINYTAKGEKSHMKFEAADFKYKDLMKALKDKDVSGWLVCESPILEDDALLLKKVWKNL